MIYNSFYSLENRQFLFIILTEWTGLTNLPFNTDNYNLHQSYLRDNKTFLGFRTRSAINNLTIQFRFIRALRFARFCF